MCFKTPKVQTQATPAPTRADVQGDVTAQRLKLRDQSGVTGNIFTSALGDSSYGQNVKSQFATLGGANR